MVKLIVGLGNPGKEYEKTRHNAGFMVLDEIANELQLTFSKSKFKGDLAQIKHKQEIVYFLKPTTYMNLSGQSVQEMMSYYRIDIKDLLVVFDDMDTAVGKIRLREQGSAGGQKGMANIIDLLATNQIYRIRLGIGKNQLYDVKDYVLSRFSNEEMKEFDVAIKNAAKACIDFMDKPFNIIMNKYNVK